MRRLRVLITCTLAAASLAAPASARPHEGRGAERPPLPGTREVQYYDDGRLVSATRIPSGSVFARQEGGGTATCDFVDRDGDPSADPPVAPGGMRPSTRFIYREGDARLGIPLDLVAVSGGYLATDGPIDDAKRVFSVFCGDGYILNLRAVITVGPRDAFWDVDSQLDILYHELDLDRPRVATEPPEGWPGFIVNNPRALAIDAAPWRRYHVTRGYRGWSLSLVAEPAALGFALEVRPRPDDGRHERRLVTTTCPDPHVGSGVVPAPPSLPDFATAGQALAACTFVPPYRGTVSITATITYHVTFWVDTFSDPQPDYTWSSKTRTYQLGEIHAVNVLPDR